MPTYCVDYMLGSANYSGATLAQPTLDEYLILFAGSIGASSFTVTAPTGFAERLDTADAETAYTSYFADMYSYANIAATDATLSGSATQKAAFLVALKPASTTPIALVNTSIIGEADQSVDAAAPASISDNDIMIAMVMASGGAVPTITPPAGWDVIGTLTPTNTRVSLYWKRCASESGTYTFSHNNATSPKMQVAIIAYRNCITTGNPYDVSSATAYVTSNATLRAAAINTTRVAGPTNTIPACVAGDTVKFAKSPDPVSIDEEATWTHASATVTLSAALTKTLHGCNNAGWTARASITRSYSTTTGLKEGSHCLTLVPDSGFLTGQMAWAATTDTGDMTAYDCISFWAYTNIDTTVNMLRIDLFEANDGTGVPVNSFTIPYILYAHNYYCITLKPDAGGALGSNINSIAVNALLDPGTRTLRFDNFLACNSNVLTLNSLIGIDGSPVPDDCYYPIRSIIGAAIILDVGPGYNGASVAPTTWSGTTDTYETFAINNMIVQPTQASVLDGTISAYSQNHDGTGIAPITYLFGCNTTDGTQDGCSWFDGVNSLGRCPVDFNGDYYLSISNVGVTRFGRLNAVSGNMKITNFYSAGCTIGINTNSGLIYAENIFISHTYTYPFQISGPGIFKHGKIVGCYDADTTVLQDNINPLVIMPAKFLDFEFRHNAGELLASNTTAQSNVEFYSCTFESNGASLFAGATWSTGVYKFDNCTFDSFSMPGTFGVDAYTGGLISTNHNQDTDDHRMYYRDGIILSEKTTRHTASGISWKMSPTATASAIFPLTLLVGQVAVSALTSITASVQVYRSGTTVVSKLTCEAFQCGLTTKVEDSAASSGEWEELSINVVPTQKGVLEFYVEVYGSASQYVYVDDFAVSQA